MKELNNFYGHQPHYILFFFFCVVDEKIDKNVIERYSRISSLYAKKNYKGKPLGENTGVVSIAMMIGHDIDQSAIDFCTNFKSSHFAIREIPVIYDTLTRRYYTFNGFRFVGFLFRNYYDNAVGKAKKIVNEAAPLSSNTSFTA